MKKLLLFIFILFSFVFTSKAADYVTVTNDCPIVTFTANGLTKLSVHKKQIKVQKTSTTVTVTIISDGSQQFTWNASQAYAYGGRTISQLYTHILSIITNPC